MLSLLLLCTAFFVSLSPQTTNKFAITLDGNIGPEEWKNASTHKLHQEGEVKIMTDARYVYVAVSGTGNGWSHVYTNRGNTVEVLHASAALGFSRYVAGKNHEWTATHSFSWELRDRTLSEQAVNNRIAYLQKNGWVGTVNAMNPTDQEYILSRSLFDSTSMRIAVARVVGYETPQYWPGTLRDSTLSLELVRGSTIDGASFTPEQWAEIPQ